MSAQHICRRRIALPSFLETTAPGCVITLAERLPCDSMSLLTISHESPLLELSMITIAQAIVDGAKAAGMTPAASAAHTF